MVMSNIGVLMARSLSTVIRLLCALCITCLVFLSNAQATNIVFDNLGNMVGSYVGSPSKVMDFIASGGRAGGAIGTSGAITVATDAGGVVVTAAAEFSPSVLSKMARIGMRGLGPLGAALTAYQIYGLVKDSGLQVCPPPDFFCKPDPNQDKTPTGGWSTYSMQGYPQNASTVEELAQKRCTIVGGMDCSTLSIQYQPMPYPDPRDSSYTRWYAKRQAPSVTVDFIGDAEQMSTSCDPGYVYVPDTKKCSPTSPKLIPASDPDIEGSMARKGASDPSFLPRVLPALQSDSKAQPGLIPPNSYLPPDLPVTVSGAPVSGAPHQVSQRTFPNSDGTTSTETVTSQATVTPTKTGGDTMSTSNTTFPTTTTVTTTTVNNTTNVTTTSTTIINPPVNDPSNKQPGKEAETGPKECGSPGKPKCSIDEAGTPTSPGTALDAPKAALDKTVTDATAQIKSVPGTARDTSWKFSFALPSGCTPYTMFLNIVIDYCQFQPIIHDVMSMVWYAATFFAIVGMFGRAARNS